MLEILAKVAYLMALTIIISFIVAFLIKLIVILINFQGSMQKYDKKYIAEVKRARSIKKMHIRRLYRETANSNEICNYRYGVNFEDTSKLVNTNNSKK